MKSKIITFNGKTQNISAWARDLGMSHRTLGARLKQGWSLERALTVPKHKGRHPFITFNGKTQSLVQWADEIGICRVRLAYRLKTGWSLERALSANTGPKVFEHHGRAQSLSAWASEYEIAYRSLLRRMRAGWTFDDAINDLVIHKRNRGRKILPERVLLDAAREWVAERTTKGPSNV